MNKKITLYLTGLLVLFSFTKLSAQLTNAYKAAVVSGTTYCPGSQQYDDWLTQRRTLDTNLYKYIKVTMKGSATAAAITGRTRSDPDIVRKIAHAYKNATNFTSMCDGNRWRVETGCQVGSPCGGTSNGVAIDVDANTTMCACNNRWIIRMGIGNQNYGGVDAPSCNSQTQTMELIFEYPGPFNNMMAQLDPLDRCDMVQDIDVKFTNGSLKPVDSFEYYYKVNGVTTGPISVQIASGPLRPLKDTTITIIPALALKRNTTYNIETFIHTVNNTPDSSNYGDTSRVTLDFLGPPDAPIAIDQVLCGDQSTILKATTSSTADSMAWYEDKAATKFLGFGNGVLTPFLNSGKTYTFWAYPYSGLEEKKIEGSFGGRNTWYGTMFDMKAAANPIQIDSITFDFNSNNLEGYEIYTREGSYNDPGATSTASMWTLQASGNIQAKGLGNETDAVPFSFRLAPGKNYAIYVTSTTSRNMLCQAPAKSYDNGDINISNAVVLNYPFTTPLFVNYGWNGAFIYRKPLCPGEPDSAVIVVNQKPVGASLDETAGFQKAPKNGGLGIAASPHVVALGDTLKYDFTNPTGFTTADLGVTWTIDNVSVTTESGRDVSASSTWAIPTGTTPGNFTYTPDTMTIDSNVQACITFTNTATGCDSTICTYIYAAPLPDPSFNRPEKICDGEVVPFTNTSTIKTGFLNHKWYFGDGDSTDAPDPIKQYAKNGTYYVTYNSISSIYGYIRTVIDTVIITQIPQVKFGIANVCDGDEHTFTNNSSVVTGALSYAWDYGDGTSSTDANKVHKHSYASNGRYIVTLSAEANGCTAELSKNAYSFPNPVANINAPSSGILCSNKPVSFTNNSTISSGTFGHIWNMGDSKLQTTRTVNYQYAAPGIYKVIYTAISEFGCKSLDSANIDIQTSPKVDFTVTEACDLTPTEFTDATDGIGSTNPAYSWDLGDGNTSGAQNPSCQYTSIGPKDVTLKVVLDNGCEDEMTKTITVKTQPLVDFEVADGCFNSTIPFDNKTKSSSGTINYNWNFGDGNSSTLADPTHTYADKGLGTQNYKVELVADIDGACQSEIFKTVIVYELPNCDFTISSGWTPGFGFRTIDLVAANTTYPYYKYKISDGGSVDGATASYQFSTDGIYEITLVARNAADCECTKTQKRYQQNSLGAASIDGENIDVYPNPSTGAITIAAESVIKTVKVYDVLGNLIASQNGNNSKTYAFNLGEKSNGIYLVKVSTDNGTSTKRIVLNK
jgi:PKD repeat protein